MGSALELLGVNVAVRRVHLFAGPLPPLPPTQPRERYWRRANADETREWIARRPPHPDLLKEYEIAVAENHWLFLAHDEDVLIGHRWVGFRRAFVRWPFTCELELAPDTAYFYDAFVSPSHRGRQIGIGAAYAGLRQLEGTGVTRCASLVSASNHASARVWVGLGVPSRVALHIVLPKFRHWLPSQPWFHAGIRIRAWDRSGIPGQTR